MDLDALTEAALAAIGTVRQESMEEFSATLPSAILGSAAPFSLPPPPSALLKSQSAALTRSQHTAEEALRKQYEDTALLDGDEVEVATFVPAKSPASIPRVQMIVPGKDENELEEEILPNGIAAGGCPLQDDFASKLQIGTLVEEEDEAPLFIPTSRRVESSGAASTLRPPPQLDDDDDDLISPPRTTLPGSLVPLPSLAARRARDPLVTQQSMTEKTTSDDDDENDASLIQRVDTMPGTGMDGSERLPPPRPAEPDDQSEPFSPASPSNAHLPRTLPPSSSLPSPPSSTTTIESFSLDPTFDYDQAPLTQRSLPTTKQDT